MAGTQAQPQRTTLLQVPGPAIHHPVFARLYTLMSSREPVAITEHRRELLAGLSGRVLELGAGAGANFAHYPAEVSEVLAVEPEPYMRHKALEAAARSPVRITVLQGTADELPAPDGSVDAAVACLVLCSVPSQATALAELRRVLRPAGELRFYEHVLSHRPNVARSQRIADRLLWPRAFGGCHTARDTPAAVSAAGFAIEEQRRIWLAPLPIAIPVATHVLGRARRT
jgi:ubiquinone/menaquinone biosynthesis C-methylase UbiE